MGIRFEHLDEVTRPFMTGEIDADITSGGLYLSNYLNDQGQQRWPTLLRQASQSGTDDTLAQILRTERSFKLQVERRKPKGGFTMVSVPVTAAQTLAESQFNMYYMRGLALRAIAEGRFLVVYRGKVVDNPRPESERLIGSQLDPKEVLQALRATKGVEPSIGIPLPNSGLTVRLS
ncbi:hypothetical protein LGR54_09965 [Ancylobacter sp. Lp-2]|uniref:hypothetical protein n=1 Tax=Ancylobacter sp. Lp-2 TaxID=2881339 RepID=UPI001E2AA739|nr:hypothetical protein [Ancylobacter sp. Lp-2]MCB4768929.1 hypothetical protein [Ancylobacter sp. Lp-2]